MHPLPCSSPIIPNSPKGEDLILGYDFLYHFNIIIDWKNGFITYYSSNKDSSGIKYSGSNALATAVNSAALVGELKTPSLPSSVHIPFIMPSQSLLKLRDEVFKEVKDFGADVAISSLHLFQGDMDLPPLSFNASLEEQWDEEEEPKEIETVLKVVPPAYHQYLHVFSKVKAEKIPPHHTCDHHIKLKGLLPPLQILKEAFTTATILSNFNPSLPAIVETDASDYALGAVLSQGQCVPRGGVDVISKNPQNFPQVIKQDGIQESRFFSIKVEIFSDLVDQIQKEIWKDKDYKEILKQLARGESVSDYSLEPQAKLLLLKDRVLVPSNGEIQLNILQKRHDSLLAAHPGQEKTLRLIKKGFYWAGMNQAIKDYVSSCQKCSRNKKINHKKFGLLKPLQIQSGSWNSLSMDFITQLPLSNNFDSILVVVDRFLKMAIFTPTYAKITALELAHILIHHVFSKHSLPASIVSDRGSLFVPSFWTQLSQKLKISRDLSAAFNPETDGQTERVNQILESIVGCMSVTIKMTGTPGSLWLNLPTIIQNTHQQRNHLSHHLWKKSQLLLKPYFSRLTCWKFINKNPISSTNCQRRIRVRNKDVKKYTDRNMTITPDFQAGDKVWLASKKTKTTISTKKLSERFLGPFEGDPLGGGS
ncbi:hypothetical protein O181_033652 [Austropuccinia psidii MF-1]|uniref:Integrase catalytic domain-containing protein n=1 Tax=Austropuccinia psidii MF-1 TaxID=1389203 RepID=A0A9Q3D517_9BASI|nr:hypothetical protein [Austropuccinia psidii MF-1]